MQPATKGNVLGDFKDRKLEHFGTTSTMFERDGKFWVNTDGPNGKLTDFEVAYAFGVTPLQQYLVKFPGGRMQSLPLCWDTRPKEDGGQATGDAGVATQGDNHPGAAAQEQDHGVHAGQAQPQEGPHVGERQATLDPASGQEGEREAGGRNKRPLDPATAADETHGVHPLDRTVVD